MQTEGKRNDQGQEENYSQLAASEPGAPPMWNPDFIQNLTVVNTLKYVKDDHFSYNKMFLMLGVLSAVVGTVSVLDKENLDKILPFIMVSSAFAAPSFISELAHLDSLRVANNDKEKIMEYPVTHQDSKQISTHLRNRRHQWHLLGYFFNLSALAGFVYTGIEFASNDALGIKLGAFGGASIMAAGAGWANTHEASNHAQRIYAGTVTPARISASMLPITVLSVITMIALGAEYGFESTAFAIPAAVPFLALQWDGISNIENVFTKSTRSIIEKKDGTDLRAQGISIGSAKPFTCFPRAKVPLATINFAMTATMQASFAAIGFAGRTNGLATATLLTCALGLMWLGVRGKFKEHMVNLPKNQLEAHGIDINTREREDIEAPRPSPRT